ncbi:hypothetical protein SBRCBS47491_006496 [Sporothrix bragantina]|uniref:Uncharacterized protein n=1 Tax=Sporothrix bragantina TaxID=671064 RepID=A0ABP0C6P3_9PEZI
MGDGGVIRYRNSDAGRLLDIIIKVVPESHYADTEYSTIIKLPLGDRLGGTAGESVSDSYSWVEHTDSQTVIQAALAFRDF